MATASLLTRCRDALRSHPIIASVIAGSILLGAVVGVFVFSTDWTISRRLLGGALAGAGVGFIVTANRIIG